MRTIPEQITFYLFDNGLGVYGSCEGLLYRFSEDNFFVVQKSLYGLKEISSETALEHLMRKEYWKKLLTDC